MRCFSLLLGLTVLLAGCNRPPPPLEPDPPSGKTLKEWINDLQAGNDSARATAVFALGGLGAEAKPALPALLVALRDQNRDVRFLAAWALVYVDSKSVEILAPLSTATRDSDPLVRIKAAESLGMIGPRAGSAIPELVALLRDPFTGVRRAAADALGQIGAEAVSALPYLTRLAELDSDENVRKAAANAIRWIEHR